MGRSCGRSHTAERQAGGHSLSGFAQGKREFPRFRGREGPLSARGPLLGDSQVRSVRASFPYKLLVCGRFAAVSSPVCSSWVCGARAAAEAAFLGSPLTGRHPLPSKLGWGLLCPQGCLRVPRGHST